VFDKCCITFQLHPVLGIHNPNNIHGTWARILISSFQTKISPTFIKIDKTLNLLPTWRWKKKIGKKLQGLPLHWFFTNDSTITKTSSITIENNMVSKSWWIAQTCSPIQLKSQMWSSKFCVNYPTHVDIFMLQLQ
jgi:hypothetical protein